MLRFLPAAICAAAVVAFACSVQHDPFFWDTVQLASKHAHHFYENGLAWSPLPAEIDSGHPPFLGWYLAAAWTFFGKTLPVSHWAMLPFLLANVWLLYRLGLRLGGPRWAWWLVPLALLDPVLAGQSALVSPDVVLTTWFLLAVEGILGKNRWFVALAVAGLCTVSMRGMMTAAALAVFFLLNFRFCGFAVLRLLPFLPGFLLGAGFLWWHWSTTGWVGYHAGSPWAGAFERAEGMRGWLRNAAVLGWRWSDLGRWAEWAVLGWLWWSGASRVNPTPGPSPRVNPTPDPSPAGRGATTYAEANTRASFISEGASAYVVAPLPAGEGSGVGLTRGEGSGVGLLLLLALFLAPSALLYANLSAHRYFLPLFLGLHLVVFQQVVARCSPFAIRPAVLLALLVVSLATGNLWVYPRGVSMDWDSTLAHLPYHAMRSEAVAFLEKQNIDFQSVGSAFPNLNTGEHLLLNGDERRFAALDFEKNRFVLASNVFNDLNEPDYQRLERDWILLKKWQHPAGVWMVLYAR